MKPILTTPRLLLREFTIDDAEDMYLLNVDEDVIKYTGDPPFSSIQHAKNFIANYDHYTKMGYGRWAVILQSSGEFTGWSGLKFNELNQVDIGFRFFKKHWGKGFATESAKASLEFGFNTLNIQEIIGRAALENKASIRVLEKIGMKYWKQDTCKGIDNSVYYRLTLKDYQNVRPL